MFDLFTDLGLLLDVDVFLLHFTGMTSFKDSCKLISGLSFLKKSFGK